MIFVCDADILSTFAKISRIDLLQSTLKGEIIIPSSVREDLTLSKSQEVRSIASIGKSISPAKDENELFQRIISKGIIGKGESECIAVCKLRKGIFVSNDQQAIDVAEQLDIPVLDLETILFKLKETLPKNEFMNLIQDIEQKDKIKLTSKDELLS